MYGYAVHALHFYVYTYHYRLNIDTVITTKLFLFDQSNVLLIAILIVLIIPHLHFLTSPPHTVYTPTTMDMKHKDLTATL